jgi:superfamily II DNA or RNA helicase
MIRLRPWQQQALDKAISWLVDTATDKHFLINAAPGSGKTIAACSIAESLISRGLVERVIVIAPRGEIVNQWAEDFRRVTGRYMGKVMASDGRIDGLGHDLCATWAAVQGLADGFQAVCAAGRTLVVCDEHHHAAVRAAWGEGANSAFRDATYVLVLTGTPIRSDGQQSVWLAYDDAGRIDHAEEGSYTLTYGQAVDWGYCRPITFHRHEGIFSVDLEDGEAVTVSSNQPAELTADLKRVPGLQRVLNFYRLACTPLFEKDETTPLSSGYQATMVEWASQKLTELRYRMPEAGGLVIAPSIEMAKYFVTLISMIEGEEPVLVHSQTPNSENKIRAFRQTQKRWIVSVAMISEGVDIKRLRVLIYLPSALTELAFRQAVGRVVRSNGSEDDTRAYVVMPSFDLLETYARRVEEEMSPGQRIDSDTPRLKRCPSCAAEIQIAENICPECGHEFPVRTPRFKSCHDCSGLNPQSAKECQHCGHSFQMKFVLSLDEALRSGAIVRGMDLDEDEVVESEALAPELRRKILASGDAKLVSIIKNLPEESWSRLKKMMED